MRQSSLVKRLVLFDFLDVDDSSGQPIVRSAAECLTEVHYAGGLHALRSSLLYGKGLPVVWRDAHLDVTPLTDKAANTFVTRCMPDQATAFQRLLAHEHRWRAGHERSAKADMVGGSVKGLATSGDSE